MSIRNQPYLPLYVQDFMTDEKLAECSAKANGVFIRLMCLMHKSDEYGKILLKQKDKQSDNQIENFASKIAKHFPYDYTTTFNGLSELINENVLVIDGDCLYQRRMVKDAKISDIRSKSGSKGGKKTGKKLRNFAKAKTEAKLEANTQAKPEANSEYEIEYEIEREIVTVLGIEFIPIWKNWIEYKQTEFKEKYKTKKSHLQAIKNLCENSKNNPEIAEKIINQSIGNSWKGLFPLKNNHNGTYQQTPNGSKPGTSEARTHKAASW